MQLFFIFFIGNLETFISERDQIQNPTCSRKEQGYKIQLVLKINKKLILSNIQDATIFSCKFGGNESTLQGK